ncbi:MAG: sugar transferase, partial [Bryobacteraceae bacterium]
MAERHTLSPHALTGQTAIAAITNGNSGSIATLLIHPGKRFRTNDIESSEESRDTGRFQRVLEILFAAVALILSAPLMLLISVLIRLDSKGPAVFQQWRVGKDGRLFRFRK